MWCERWHNHWSINSWNPNGNFKMTMHVRQKLETIPCLHSQRKYIKHTSWHILCSFSIIPHDHERLQLHSYMKILCEPYDEETYIQLDWLVWRFRRQCRLTLRDPTTSMAVTLHWSRQRPPTESIESRTLWVTNQRYSIVSDLAKIPEIGSVYTLRIAWIAIVSRHAWVDLKSKLHNDNLQMLLLINKMKCYKPGDLLWHLPPSKRWTGRPYVPASRRRCCPSHAIFPCLPECHQTQRLWAKENCNGLVLARSYNALCCPACARSTHSRH